MAVVYREPARSFISTAVLLGLFVAGFLFDLLVIGGGRAHIVAWVGGAVIVLGADALTIHAARSVRSILLTEEAIRVGDEEIERALIAAVRLDVADAHSAVGCPPGAGLPRGAAGLGLTLSDGTLLVVPTRHPVRLAELLELAPVRPPVRAAEPDELALLPEIAERADSLFRVSGLDLPEIPFPLDALHDAVAVFVVGRPPVGFAQLDEVDGLAHLAEMAVLPAHMRQGLGSALIEAGCAWAAERGYSALTLTTYADVAWNGPFYAARGFVAIEATPEIAELRDWERLVGLDALGPRIAMRRSL